MMRQVVQTDRVTGRVIHYYVPVGKGRVRPRLGSVEAIVRAGGDRKDQAERSRLAG